VTVTNRATSVTLALMTGSHPGPGSSKFASVDGEESELAIDKPTT